MRRWLVTGAAGMLGQDLMAVLRQHGQDVTGLSRRDLDVRDECAVREALGRHHPAVVVNCAAWTAVDDAEAHEPEALLVNGDGAAHLAAACRAVGARLVQVSTDYVFSGDSRQPYAEDDSPAPRTAYGRTKLGGERAVLEILPDSGYVVRTAWLYGAHGHSFVHAMMGRAGRPDGVDVVADQWGQPTWTVDVAERIIALIGAEAAAGIYHATSAGQATWFALAREVFRLLDADPARVRATTSSSCPRPAPRPAWSVLSHDRLVAAGIEPIGGWRSSLGRAFPLLLPGAPAARPAEVRPPRGHDVGCDLQAARGSRGRAPAEDAT
jgi:dTDP-4-dehydrorhamnose reductase